jgi:hypothetical protein
MRKPIFDPVTHENRVDTSVAVVLQDLLQDELGGIRVAQIGHTVDATTKPKMIVLVVRALVVARVTRELLSFFFH